MHGSSVKKVKKCKLLLVSSSLFSWNFFDGTTCFKCSKIALIISLYLGIVGEVGLEDVFDVRRIDGVSVGASRHWHSEGSSALEVMK